MFEYADGRVSVQNLTPGKLSAAERATLRELAARVSEAGHHPIQAEKIALHRSHNAMNGGRPVILCFPEGAWEELVPAGSMTCTDPFWRGYELYLRRLLYRWAHLPDDVVIEPSLGVPLCAELTNWGVEPQRLTLPTAGSSWRYEPVLSELAQWRQVLRPIDLRVDEEKTRQAVQAVGDVLDDLLPVYVDRSFTEANPLLMETVCQLRGMENLYYDLIDEEEELHALLGFLRDGWLALYDRMEQEPVYTPNTGNQYVGSGGVGYCDLAADQAHPLKEMWGFCETQELSNVSPEMYQTFATEYYKPLLARFGLGCVGCCENLDGKLEELVESLTNLRRVSISPWTDLMRAREEIGGKVILSWKPNPSMVSGPTYDRDEIHSWLAAQMAACRDVPYEVILKDVQTVAGQGERLTDFIRMARSELGV